MQISIVDVRPLLAVPTHRHAQPAFPRPDRVYSQRSALHHQTSFVAGVGPVRPRLTGAAGPRSSENYYVDVASLIRLGRMPPGLKPLFRHFHTDGVVGRL